MHASSNYCHYGWNYDYVIVVMQWSHNFIIGRVDASLGYRAWY